MNLVAHILALLKENEHVIIPGFGGFVARYQAASIHPVHQVISPPNRKLAFNSSLNHKDGLLISCLMEKDHLGYEQSEAAIKSFAATCRQTLDNKDILMLPGIGKLFFDLDQNIQFVQDHTVNILPASFALPRLELSPRKKEDVDREVVRSIKEAGRGMNLHAIAGRQKLIWFAALFTLITAFGAFALFDHNIQTTTSNFFEYLKGPDTMNYTDQKIDHESLIAYKVSEASSFSNPDFDYLRELIKDQIEVENTVPVISNSSELPFGYFVVVGSFGTQSNANKLQQDLSDKYSTYILPASNGFNRVAIYVSNIEAQAMTALSSIRSDLNSDAWVLKR